MPWRDSCSLLQRKRLLHFTLLPVCSFYFICILHSCIIYSLYPVDGNLRDIHVKSLIQTLNINEDHIYYLDPPGEESKCRAKKAEIEDWLFSVGCARDSCLVGIGGGVITDMVGFIAVISPGRINLLQCPNCPFLSL